MSNTLALTEQLIRCPSQTPLDAGCQAIIRERLERLSFTLETMTFSNVENLWARRGTEGPLIVFAGHTDVVPPGPLTAWTHPPFEPTIKNGLLYGRGATDMKSGLAAMLVAAERFIQENPDYPGSIAFLITSDEEGASINGTKKVIETLTNRNEKIDYCIIGEASSEEVLGDQIRVGRRGSLHGKLTIFGKQGHIAYPARAKNPIHLAAPLLAEWVNISWDEGNEFFPPTTFQLSNIHAGTGATNVIPGSLDIQFNFRFGTALTVEEIQRRITESIEKHSLDFDLQWDLSGLPFLTQQGRLVDAAQKAIKTITTLEPHLSTGGGTSDGRFIAPTGAEVIELGPLNSSAHQVDEHVLVTDLDKLTAIYERLLSELLYPDNLR